MRRRPHAAAAGFLVAYAAENRTWADWVRHLLRRAGCDVTLHDISTGPLAPPDPSVRTVVLLSKVFEKSRHAASVRHALTGWADDTGRPRSSRCAWTRCSTCRRASSTCSASTRGSA